jgi:hypothetical protein
MLFFVVLLLLSIWALFWIIRLAVRYGMNDALRMNRSWLAKRDDVPKP